MKVLVIGSGGREHALAWKLAQSDQVAHVFIAPGNAGTALERKCSNITISADDIQMLLQFAKAESIKLTIVGPELPLSLGIVDLFQRHNLRCFGPSQAAAQLECSKSFCKQFLSDNNIPTADFKTFNKTAEAIHYLQQQSFPIVIKASGLAAGKGVVIADDLISAETCVRDMLDEQQFGEAGAEIVIEEFLKGEELSFIAIVDGDTILPLASSQDHKRLKDNDLGPNTGGMGAYSPAPLCNPALEKLIMKEVMEPTVKAMQAQGTPYLGFLYAGLMVNNNRIKVLEFNCRLGDPETQPLMCRLQSDLAELCLAACNKQLRNISLQWDARSALTVVMAAEGYPQQYAKGKIITGLNTSIDHTKVFHAGTTTYENTIVTSGGRVLGVSALGDTLEAAKQRAYQRVGTIQWDNCFYRTDIGNKALP